MTEVELECAAGVDNLPQKLEEDVVHGPNWNDRKYKYQKKLNGVKRSGNEDIMDFTVRWNGVHKESRDNGVTPDDETAGNTLLDAASLTKGGKALVLGRAHDNTKREIEKALKRIFPKEEKEPDGTKDKVYVIERTIPNEPQQEVEERARPRERGRDADRRRSGERSGSEDNQVYYVRRQGKFFKKRFNRNYSGSNRGSSQSSYRSSSQGSTGGGNPRNAKEGGKTRRCYNCGSEYHIARDCPRPDRREGKRDRHRGGDRRRSGKTHLVYMTDGMEGHEEEMDSQYFVNSGE